MCLEMLTDNEIVFALSPSHHFVRYRKHRIVFGIDRATHRLDLMLMNVKGVTGLDSADNLDATYDLTNYNAQNSTLYVDAYAVAKIISWALKRKNHRSFFKLQCFVENLFHGGNNLALGTVIKAALYATLDADTWGEADHWKHRALKQHPEAFAELQKGNPSGIPADKAYH